ncbi:MAG: toprim domain-containing protein [Bacteroidota bacterium]
MSAATELARRLAHQAEAVCRAYLPHGRRAGAWWHAGDVFDTPGRSLFVRLQGERAGKWTDAATGEHGDLLDLIARTCRFARLDEALAEARAFLSLPQPCSPSAAARSDSPEAARRLFRLGCPIPGTPAEAYLRARGITALLDWPCLRFHPAVWYRAHPDASHQSWPALLAAVTDGRGIITGIQRCWLDRRRPAKAPLADPRRSLGHLLGNGVRFGTATEVMAAGEGIETMLALKSVLPTLPMVAALSAGHLAALVFAPSLVRLYVVRDNDAAGRKAVERLSARGFTAGLDVRPLVPMAEDFNADLLRFGPDRMRARLAEQLAPEDAERFLPRLRGA